MDDIDRTFKKLTKWTYEDANRWHSSKTRGKSSPTSEEVFAVTGWTLSEMVAEAVARILKKDH